jgi:hypothetical protein
MDNNENILTELADFDVKYAKYIYCNNSKNNLTNCLPEDKNMATLTDAYDKLVKKGSNGANLKNMRKVINKNPNDIMSNDEYLKRYNSTIKRYNKVVNYRRKLDDKMKILYNVDNKITYDNQLKYDATVYSGIVWTVLASSLVYYMFSKL